MVKESISFVGNTDLGKMRTNNEDAFIAQHIWDDKHVLAVVIDGVGGYEGGEVAAEIAQNTIVEYLKKYPNGERLNLLKQAVTEANNRIIEERSNQPKLANMSCVLTACLIEIDKKQINMVHVGDTRLYQYHHNELQKLSHDHSLIGYREEIGDLTEDEAMNHPQRNVIGRDIGSEVHQIDDKDFLEAGVFSLQPNSTLLLCSDGLSDMLKSAEIIAVLNQNISLESKVQDLIDFANKKGGKDNITVVLVEYVGNEYKPAEAPKRVFENKVPQSIQPVEKNKKSKYATIRILLMMIAVLLIGIISGWLIRDNCSNFFSTNGAFPDSTKYTPKDTIIEVMHNDSLRIYVTGKELKMDTVKIKE